jgi:hypothetical protein
MKKTLVLIACAGFNLLLATIFLFSSGRTQAAPADKSAASTQERPPIGVTPQRDKVLIPYRGFQVQVLVNGRPLEEYVARGRTYVEAIEGAEYELRIYNPLPVRVAVALSVDGLNTIDARHTRAWEASKWVIGPYQTIYISGWQVSAERARHFYFTTERDSYGAKLGQTANLGVISVVFFRERQPLPVPVIPPPRPPRPYEDSRPQEEQGRRSNAPPASARKEQKANIYPTPDDESAATGIGRSVTNDVRWVEMDLDRHPTGEVNIRYEYYPALVRLGILPRPYPRPDSLRRREDARGFEGRQFSPEP